MKISNFGSKLLPETVTIETFFFLNPYLHTDFNFIEGNSPTLPEY